MARILISWIALINDFNGTKVNIKGPTFDFHQNFYKGYEKHILLSTESEETADYSKAMLLYSELRKEFTGRDIKLERLGLEKKEVIDFNRIHAKVYPILLALGDSKIDIFISPGTPAMQVVWYFIYLEMKSKVRLLQTVKPEDSKNNKPELIDVTIDNSPLVDFLIVKEESLKKRTFNIDDTYCITESLKPIYTVAHEIALSPKTTVLIQGETGTGKEHLAREIHDNSSRKRQAYISVNCAAISPDLLESRLFGYEKGAFSNALKTTEGLFQAANKGTIFLDEIGDVNPQMQVALLRILQTGEFQKVGSTVTEIVDVRIIAATNKDLYEECSKGHFRWDLYYRICIAELQLPPLRERGKTEIKRLLEFFNHQVYKKFLGKRNLITFTIETIDILCDYGWPGNIRELQNLMERFYAYGKSVINIEDLPQRVRVLDTTNSLRMEDVCRAHARRVVDLSKGNLTKAKNMLGLGSINTLKKYLS